MYLTIHDDPDDAEWKAVDDGLGAYDDRFAPPAAFQRLAVFLRDDDGNLLGGLLGETYWGWLYVETLWVAEGARGQGWGAQLLAAGEAVARDRGCTRVHLDTMDFQALPFYQKQGYSVWGTLDDFIGGHARYFLKKEIAGSL